MNRKFQQVEIIDIDHVIVQQISGLFLFELGNGLAHLGKVLRGLAGGVCQLRDIGGHQRAFAVKEEIPRMGIIGQRIERAAERFVIIELAAVGSQIGAIVFDANRAEAGSFCLCQTDFKRWMTGINRAALLALSTVVKQHARTPTRKRVLLAYRTSRKPNTDKPLISSCGCNQRNCF